MRRLATGELRARPDAELPVDARERRLHGLPGHVEPRRDLGVPQALRRELGDALLGRRQRVGRPAPPAESALLGLDPGDPQGIAERLERRPRLGERRRCVTAAAETPQDSRPARAACAPARAASRAARAPRARARRRRAPRSTSPRAEARSAVRPRGRRDPPRPVEAPAVLLQLGVESSTASSSSPRPTRVSIASGCTGCTDHSPRPRRAEHRDHGRARSARRRDRRRRARGAPAPRDGAPARPSTPNARASSTPALRIRRASSIRPACDRDEATRVPLRRRGRRAAAGRGGGTPARAPPPAARLPRPRLELGEMERAPGRRADPAELDRQLEQLAAGSPAPALRSPV